MGAVHTRVRIINPADGDRYWDGEFLVDTGFIDTLVPAPFLEEIGLKPEQTRVYTLADGSEYSVGVGVAKLELLDEKVGVTVLFGEPDTEPLLGCTALESAGFEVDPVNQRLKKMPVLRL